MYPPNLVEFFPQYDETELTELLNTLPMNPVDFARRSDTYELMFGVKTGSSRSKDSHNDPLVANSCLRQALLDLLVSVSSESEKLLGFLMRDRFVEEEVPVIFGKKLETTFAGVSAINVVRTWEAVAGLADIEIIYKTVDPPVVEEIDGKSYAQLPVSEVPNPHNVWIRKVDTDGAFAVPAGKSPQWVANSGDPYWLTPLDTSPLRFEEGDVLYVNDKQYAYIDITPPTLEFGETLSPVYPGTDLMIPLARPVDVLENGDHRYWFYVYTLVLPDLYYDDEINLEDVVPEYWKMLRVVDFKKWYESSSPMEVTVTIGDQVDVYEFDPLDETNPTINAVLVSEELGIYHFSIDPSFSFEAHCGYTPASVTAKIRYRVSPSLLGVQYKRQITRIVQAMSYKVGAEMPMLSCDCPLESSFLAQQRRETGTVKRNLFTNVEEFKIGYSNRIGNDAYRDIMSTMMIKRTAIPKI